MNNTLPCPPADITEEQAEQLFQEHFKRHQQAFRVAFDLLKSTYPPGSGPEYWSATNAACILAMKDHEDNPLVQRLVRAVHDYLDATRAEWDKERMVKGVIARLETMPATKDGKKNE